MITEQQPADGLFLLDDPVQVQLGSERTQQRTLSRLLNKKIYGFVSNSHDSWQLIQSKNTSAELEASLMLVCS